MDWFQPIFFYFNWKIFTWNNCFIIINFVIMIQCKINFDIIWYSLIFAATLYFSLFVWLSNFLNFVFMKVVILVGILQTRENKLFEVKNMDCRSSIFHFQSIFRGGGSWRGTSSLYFFKFSCNLTPVRGKQYIQGVHRDADKSKLKFKVEIIIRN